MGSGCIGYLHYIRLNISTFCLHSISRKLINEEAINAPKPAPLSSFSRANRRCVRSTSDTQSPGLHGQIVDVRSRRVRGVRPRRGEADIETARVVHDEELAADRVEAEFVHELRGRERFALEGDVEVVEAALWVRRLWCSVFTGLGGKKERKGEVRTLQNWNMYLVPKAFVS